jgi:hypothetical protein
LRLLAVEVPTTDTVPVGDVALTEITNDCVAKMEGTEAEMVFGACVTVYAVPELVLAAAK